MGSLGHGWLKAALARLTGKAEHGGLQIAVWPMKREIFDERFPKVERRESDTLYAGMDSACLLYDTFSVCEMGLAPGGRMRQEIHEDPFGIDDWDADSNSRCFVHIANSLVWRTITGENPPTTPPTATEYARARLPWFEYYGEQAGILDGADALAKRKSIATIGAEKGESPLPENQSVTPEHIVQLRKGLREDQVREGAF